ncbi:MAG: hemolysin family protein [Bacteroidetes bacterium]|nr:hemolysin family protein [Bacteroidota bacterium]MCZ6899216.1 hemolysin family protein [Bacteroidota bacterium]
MEYNQLIIIFISLFFSALFSGMEIAFISANKLHIELQSKQGVLSGKILSRFLNKSSSFIGTTLVGNNLALVVYGIFMANILEPIISAGLPPLIHSDLTILIIQTIIATLIVLVTAEFTPKSIFLINPDRMLSVFAIPMLIIYYFLYPLVFLIVSLSKLLITGVLRLEYSEDKPVFGLTDLNNYIKNTLKEKNQEAKFEVDTKIFHNALEFKTVRIRECMIPRTEIVAVDMDDDIDELKAAFIKSGHSKILVYKETIDDVVGYYHSLELFKKPKELEKILTPITIVPETMLANELLFQLITERKSLALVVDEFGGTSGIVTIEDIIEEIFGEIQDEHDTEDLSEIQIDPNTYQLSARHEIDYLNEKYHWNIPDGDYETLGGFILSANENIPNINDVINIPPFSITITSMEEARIDKVKLYIKPSKEKEG